MVPLIYFALNAVGSTAAALHSQALNHLAKGECDDAKSAADQVIALDPQWPEAFNDRGSAYYCLGQFANAESDFRAAIAHSKNYPEAVTTKYYFNLASVLVRLDVAKWQQSLSFAHQDESLELLKKVDMLYQTRDNMPDSETIENLALAEVMYGNCQGAQTYIYTLSKLRTEGDVVSAVKQACDILSGKTTEAGAAKNLPQDLQWIFSSNLPSDKKFDYLIPVQVALQRARN
jgi:tetratricopeptide (TPR) repeat protein